MVSGAIIVELTGQPKGGTRRFTVPDVTSIEKGDLLRLVDPKTVSGGISAETNQAGIAGIAAEEKVSSDGATSIGVWQKGIFELGCNGNEGIPCGAYVTLSGANNKIAAASNIQVLSGQVLGRALETASANETIQVAVNL